MAELDYQTAAASVPGMPAGEKIVAPVAPGNPPGEVPRLPSDKDAAKKSVVPHGGNPSGRPRNDGLIPGSPEAKEADREKNRLAKQKQRERERERQQRLQQPAAPLPPASPAEPAISEAQTPASNVAGVALIEVGLWTASDFNLAVPSVISFAEKYRVDRKTKKAIEGNLPPAVAEQMGASYAFLPEVKDSLRSASPETLAKLFNQLRIPIALKPAVSLCPALAYQWIRDAQLDAKLNKMIAEQSKERKTLEAVRKASEGDAYRP